MDVVVTALIFVIVSGGILGAAYWVFVRHGSRGGIEIELPKREPAA